MWFRKLSVEDQLAVAEFICWSEAAYPYDFLGCGRCITDHAVRGCENHKHDELVVLAHEAKLHIHHQLVWNAGIRRPFKTKLKLGQWLIANRGAILHLRRIYAHLWTGMTETTLTPTEADVSFVDQYSGQG